jgi:hypothetical protein
MKELRKTMAETPDSMKPASGKARRCSLLPFWLADLLAEIAGSPPDTYWTRIGGGVAAPLVLALLSLQPLLTRTVRMYSKANPVEPAATGTGTVAVLLGLAILCGAAFLHFHFAWPHRNEMVAGLGKLLSFVVGASLAVAFFWKMAVG